MSPQLVPRSAHGAFRVASLLLSVWIALTLVWIGTVPSVRAQERVEPLEVPRGVGPVPERHRELDPVRRIELGLESRRERGQLERPVLAWSLLQEAQRSSSTELASRAVEAAPSTPMIVFEGMKAGADGAGPLVLLDGFRRNVPALLWASGVLAVAVMVGLLAAASVLTLVGFARTLGLHAHAIGHLLPWSDAPPWLGHVGVLTAIALLPVLGAGPASLLALLAALTIVRSSTLQAVWLSLLAGLAGVALGPGLDGLARILTYGSAQPHLAAAWRADGGEPLPSDALYLEAAASGGTPADSTLLAGSGRADATPPDPFAVYAWGNALKHRGELDEAERVLARRGAADRLIESRSSNLLGILRLARGDVPGALSEFERARAVGESATVLYNLSQAYARNVELLKRESLYAAARDLDPERVSRYAALEGANVHRYVIQEPLPLGIYLRHALRDTSQARAWAGDLRARLLGPRLPGWGWLLLPLAAIAGWVLRRGELVRCRRCDRPICSECSPGTGAGTATCARCDRLFSARARIDARVRKQQTELDRKQQRDLSWIRCAWMLSFPGVGAWLFGSTSLGAARVLAAGAAIGVLIGAAQTPVPFEVGSFAATLVPLGLVLLAGLYGLEFVGVRRELRPRGRA